MTSTILFLASFLAIITLGSAFPEDYTSELHDQERDFDNADDLRVMREREGDEEHDKDMAYLNAMRFHDMDQYADIMSRRSPYHDNVQNMRAVHRPWFLWRRPNPAPTPPKHEPIEKEIKDLIAKKKEAEAVVKEHQASLVKARAAALRAATARQQAEILASRKAVDEAKARSEAAELDAQKASTKNLLNKILADIENKKNEAKTEERKKEIEKQAVELRKKYPNTGR